MTDFLRKAYSKPLFDQLYVSKYGAFFNETWDSNTCLALPCDAFDINSVHKLATAVLDNQSIQYAAFIDCIDTWLTSKMIEWREVFELRKAESEVDSAVDVLGIDDTSAIDTLRPLQPNIVVNFWNGHHLIKEAMIIFLCGNKFDLAE